MSAPWLVRLGIQRVELSSLRASGDLLTCLCFSTPLAKLHRGPLRLFTSMVVILAPACVAAQQRPQQMLKPAAQLSAWDEERHHRSHEQRHCIRHHSKGPGRVHQRWLRLTCRRMKAPSAFHTNGPDACMIQVFLPSDSKEYHQNMAGPLCGRYQPLGDGLPGGNVEPMMLNRNTRSDN